jgi:phage baseplate assembly protein W
MSYKINTPTTPTTSTFSGIAFPPRKSSSGFFAMETDLDLITDSIYVLLNSKKGCMPGNPSFGSSAQDLIFQPINDTTQSLVADAIISDIATWEPRVTVTQITAATSQNTRIFELVLQMKSTGQTISQTVSFSLDY